MEGMLRISLPAEVRDILQTLRAKGYTAYAVGGCVRDSLLGAVPNDWDICTAARPEQTADCFPGERVLLTGARYGTVTLLRGEAGYEITTFRAERGYSDARHPSDVDFLDTLAGDLSRRDFTINAMAADENGCVVDPFGGRDDLKRGILRCVGEPAARFTEDALRMLRALRFASRFDLRVERHTASALHELRDLLHRVSSERIAKELCGLLRGAAAARVLREFSDVVCIVLPELSACIGFDQHNPHHAYDVWEHTLHALDAAEPDVILRLAVLLHDIGKPDCFSTDAAGIGHFYNHAERSEGLARAALTRLHFDRETIGRVTRLIAEHSRELPADSPKTLRRLLVRMGGAQDARMLLRLRRADRMGTGTRPAWKVEQETAAFETALAAVLAQKPPMSVRDLALSGGELMTLGLHDRQIGQMQQRLLTAVLDGTVENNREALSKLVKSDLKSENEHGID